MSAAGFWPGSRRSSRTSRATDRGRTSRGAFRGGGAPLLMLSGMEISILDLERAALAGWQAPQEARLGGWVLRAGEGFTGRANSCLAIGDPGRPIEEAVAEVCAWYAARGLPAMIAVPYETGRPSSSAVD